MATACGSRAKVSPASNGGPPGDLYVFLKVKEHAFFERQEADLHCTIPINMAQAALGCEIDVPTLEQPSKLKIPEGTQNGAQFKLRHKGVAVLNSSSRGDLYVHIAVKTPTRLTRANSARCSSSSATRCRWIIALRRRASSRRSKTTSCKDGDPSWVTIFALCSFIDFDRLGDPTWVTYGKFHSTQFTISRCRSVSPKWTSRLT